MTLTPSSFDDSFFAGDNSLLKRSSDDIQEKIIAAILFARAFVSVATTIGIVAIIFTETWGFFQEISIAQFFLDTRWTPLFGKRRGKLVEFSPTEVMFSDPATEEAREYISGRFG